MALRRQLRVLGTQVGLAHLSVLRRQAAGIATHAKVASDTLPTDQPPKPSFKPTPLRASTQRPNPWDVLTPFLGHAAFARPPTAAQVSALLQSVRRARLGHDTSAELRQWCAALWPGPGSPAGGPDALDAEPSCVDGELVRAHTSVAHIKHGYARGRFAGRQNVAQGWQADAQAGAMRAALLADARRRQQPGVALNLLLEAPMPSAMTQPSAVLGRTATLRAAVESARALYGRLVAGTGHAGVWDALWGAENVRAGVTALQRMVGGRQQPGSDGAADGRIAEAARALMQAARLCNDAASVHAVFAQCLAWLRGSVAAYNILLYSEARTYDAKAAVHVLKMMRAAGVRPDAHTWTTLMGGMLAAGRVDLATKLFALHMDFLPRLPAGGTVQPGAACLYAPAAGALLPPLEAPGNVWEEWYAADLRRGLDPFVTSWLRDLAIEHHEGAGRVHERHVRIRSMRGMRRRKQPEIPVPDSPPVPWLPTLATHRLLLRALFRAQRTAQAVAHFALLRRVWPQYRKWAGEPEDAPAGGLRGLERLLHGHLALVVPRVRTLHGLVPITENNTASAAATGSRSPYYRHCSGILRMIAEIGSEGDSGGDAGAGEPVDRLVYAKALHAYALQGDVATVLHHMRRHRGLNDVAVWTEVVRGICEQILADPHDAELLFPYGFDASLSLRGLSSSVPQSLLKPDGVRPSWINFVLIMAAMLASRGVHLTQVSYGIVVQTAARLGDVQAVARVVEYMHGYSPERFNTEMLRMVLLAEGLAFADKCRLVRRVLDVDLGGDAGGALRLARASTMRVNASLVSFVVGMAAEPGDVGLVRSLVEFIVQRYGIRLRDHDYAHIINTCRRHGMREDVAYWMEHRHRLDMYY
ncbi:hypothetical protein LPJ53_002686 [Coemansia erecta]|uniref:Pentacotripeptide-repeat region of PRORP domain-containing protein n=1 Tax=Coemansia erecta TaxID=147472 RepID=A0A9W7Y2S6_9FUNG|nr:hypothetical protein LPJ53_002686 [Coemansia erecta]